MDTNQISRARKLKRGLKIGCLSVVVFFLLLVSAGIGWFFYVTRQVEVHDKDLIVDFKNVPDNENGFFTLDVAQLTVKQEEELDTISLCVTNNIPSDENLKAYRLFIAKHPDVLNAFYSVAEHKYCQVPLEEDVPLFLQKGLKVSGLLSLGHLSLCHIESLIVEDRISEALDCFEEHMRVGQMIAADSHNLITGMLGFVLNRMAKDLFITHLSMGSFSDLDYARIEKMVLNLDISNNWERMIRAEYCSTKSAVELVGDNLDSSLDYLPRFGRYVYNESIVLDWLARYFNDALLSLDNPEIQPEMRYIPSADTVSGIEAFRLWWSGELVNQMVLQVVAPSLDLKIRHISCDRVNDDLLRVYLALWKYHMDFDMLPERLDVLVPEYLSVLPVDFYSCGQPFEYDRERKILSSMGREETGDRERLSISLSFVD